MSFWSWSYGAVIPAGPPPPPPPPPGVTLPSLLRAGLGFERLELWSDVEVNGGIRLVVIAYAFDVVEQKSIRGEHTVSFKIPMQHPAVKLYNTPIGTSNFRVNQVVRFVRRDRSWTEHRIMDAARENNRGLRTRSIVAQSIFQDLAERGMVTKVQADGTSLARFTAMGMTMAQHLSAFLLPAMARGGQPFWQVGLMEHSLALDITYDGDSVMSGLRKLSEAAGDLEPYIIGSAGGYSINIIEQIGSSAEVMTVRANRNLIDMLYSERSAEQATRVYAFGGDNGQQQAHLGMAEWDVLSVFIGAEGTDIVVADPAGGKPPIQFDGQFMPVNEDEDRYHLDVMTGGQWTKPIIATFASGGTAAGGSQVAAAQTIRVESTTAPPNPSGSGRIRVRIVRDALKTQNMYVDHPVMVSNYGVRVGKLERHDIPATTNLVFNGLGRSWSADSLLPTAWQAPSPSSMIVTRETDSRYWEHGGQAVRIRILNTSGYIYGPAASIPYDMQGFLSFFARITTIQGNVRVGLLLSRKATDILGAPTPDFPWVSASAGKIYWFPYYAGLLVGENAQPDLKNIQYKVPEDIGFSSVWDLTKYPLYGGTATILVHAGREFANDPTTVAQPEFVISGFQVTNSERQLPLLEGSGGARLHQAANRRAVLFAPPAASVSANLVDLLLDSGWPFPYSGVQVGGAVRLVDADSDVFVGTRVVGVTRDWSHGLMPSIEFSNERTTLTSLLAKPKWTPRADGQLVSQDTRGQTFGDV